MERLNGSLRAIFVATMLASTPAVATAQDDLGLPNGPSRSVGFDGALVRVTGNNNTVIIVNGDNNGVGTNPSSAPSYPPFANNYPAPLPRTQEPFPGPWTPSVQSKPPSFLEKLILAVLEGLANGLGADANTGQPRYPTFPGPVSYPPTTTGFPRDPWGFPTTTPPFVPDARFPNGYPVDPRTGYPVDPRTGYPVDPRTGYPVDPRTGYPVDPRTGYPMDPRMGGHRGPQPWGYPQGYPTTRYPIDPRTGYPQSPGPVQTQPRPKMGFWKTLLVATLEGISRSIWQRQLNATHVRGTALPLLGGE